MHARLLVNLVVAYAYNIENECTPNIVDALIM
jgi:hypothetical protein